MITQEELKERLHYCPERGVFTWLCRRGGKASECAIAGCLQICGSGKPYITIRFNRKLFLAHRLAYLYMTGSFPENDIDHENGNGTDNRWSNLKPITNHNNQKNKRLYSRNTSGHCGVSFYKNRYRVRIVVNRKDIHIGCFSDINAAIAARKAAELEHGFHSNHGTDRPL